jgi:hypothetical protein
VAQKIHLIHLVDNRLRSFCGLYNNMYDAIIPDVSSVTCLTCLKFAKKSGSSLIEGLGKSFKLCGLGANKSLKIILKPLPLEDIQVVIDFVLEKMEAWIEPPPKER